MRYKTKYGMILGMEEKVNANLDIAISTLQNMNDNDLNHITQEGDWSILQNLEHLNYYAQYYIPEIQKALQKATREIENTTYKSSWFGAYFIGAMDYRKDKKYKAFKAYIPSRELDSKKVVAEYISNNEALLPLLRIAKEKKLRSAKVPVSIAKYLKVNVGDIIQVLIFHEERHMERVKKLLKALV